MRGARVPLYPLKADAPRAKFGFWDLIDTPATSTDRSGAGSRSLAASSRSTADSFFTRDGFDQAYGRSRCAELKAKYDALHRVLRLCDKCALRG
jgi:hypothetical protein